MKRLLSTLVCLVVLAVAALPAGAQTRRQLRSANRVAAEQQRRYEEERYRGNRSIWDKHRDKITTAGGAAGGAILGGLLGGKKGALIGAITGGSGAAVYTYKVRDKGRQY